MPQAKKQRVRKPIHVILPEALRQRFVQRMEEDHRTMTAVLVLALEAYLGQGKA